VNNEGKVNWDGLLEPGIVLPSQLGSKRQDPPSIIGCKKLLVAVLEDAIDAYSRGALAKSVYARLAHHEAYAWFMSREEKFIFSFMGICHILDIDPSWLRKAVLKKFGAPLTLDEQDEQSLKRRDRVFKKAFRRDYPSHRSRMVPSRRPLR